MELPLVGGTVNDFVAGFLSVVATLFVFAVCLGAVALVVMYIIEVTQTRQAIRCNYPLVGRFRVFFEHLGEFFLQLRRFHCHVVQDNGRSVPLNEVYPDQGPGAAMQA